MPPDGALRRARGGSAARACVSLMKPAKVYLVGARPRASGAADGQGRRPPQIRRRHRVRPADPGGGARAREALGRAHLHGQVGRPPRLAPGRNPRAARAQGARGQDRRPAQGRRPVRVRPRRRGGRVPRRRGRPLRGDSRRLVRARRAAQRRHRRHPPGRRVGGRHRDRARGQEGPEPAGLAGARPHRHARVPDGGGQRAADRRAARRPRPRPRHARRHRADGVLARRARGDGDAGDDRRRGRARRHQAAGDAGRRRGGAAAREAQGLRTRPPAARRQPLAVRAVARRRPAAASGDRRDRQPAARLRARPRAVRRAGDAVPGRDARAAHRFRRGRVEECSRRSSRSGSSSRRPPASATWKSPPGT